MGFRHGCHGIESWPMQKLFEGGGEVGALMRDMDWSATPLGPAEAWPQSLRTVVRIMLTSRYAMWLGWGPDLAFLYNDAYAHMTLGAKHPWALGRPAREVWAEIWPEIAPRIDKVMSSGESTWDEALMLFLERNGYAEETYHTFSYSPVPNDEGKIAGNFCVVTEETERVIGERRLASLRMLAAGLATAATLDDVSAAVELAVAEQPADLPFSMIYTLDAGGTTARIAARVGTDETHPAALPAFALDRRGASRCGRSRRSSGARGSSPWISTAQGRRGFRRGLGQTAGPRADGSLRAPGPGAPSAVFVAGLNPIAPDDTYRSFISLFVGQIAAGLANARRHEEERERAEALAAIDRAKTAFFSNVSHEFRTPLTLMLGPTEDALSGSGVMERRELETVYRNELRLLKLVNSLLEFSRIEAGRSRATYQAADLSALTADLASTFRSAIERGGLRFEVDCPPLFEPAFVDLEMWEKIVLNLLSNAFKFTLEGTVRVALRAVDGQAVLTVEDTGVGIPVDELPHVFERFHRIEGSRARTHEGSGIGLALVQDLVGLHGGTIDVASRPDHGATFTVRLPLGSAHLDPDRIGLPAGAVPGRSGTQAFIAEAERWLDGGAPPEEEPKPGSGAGDVAVARGRIVLADDNADMRDYLRRLLGGRWAVEAVRTGREALDAVCRERADLVITDVMMPDMDGFALLSALKADDRTRDIPVLMLSARAGEEMRLEGLQAGADDYLVKPFSARELLARVEMQLLRASMRAVEDRQRRQLEVANRTKDEFLAMLGHELRNPLAPILTALQLMRLRGGDALEKERTVIERQTRHLVRLVDDLLDVSRIARGKIDLRRERVDLADVVAKAIEMSSPLLEERQHDLSVDVPRDLAVDADPARLAQVFANLLTNSAKYTETGGSIQVTTERVGESITIRVKDDGIGIAPEMLPHVFDMFAQERQALDRTRGGLGLGLTIVKTLTELHGGSVEVSSAGRGQGSEFVVRLPAAAAAATALHAAAGKIPAAVTSHSAGAAVLIVDDNQDAAEMLAHYVECLGYRVRIALDGPSALNVAREMSPRIALLDIGLPVMDGFELAGRVRELPGLGALKLIAITGYGQETDRDRARSAGFDAHMVKPVDMEALEVLLRSMGESAT